MFNADSATSIVPTWLEVVVLVLIDLSPSSLQREDFIKLVSVGKLKMVPRYTASSLSVQF